MTSQDVKMMWSTSKGFEKSSLKLFKRGHCLKSIMIPLKSYANVVQLSGVGALQCFEYSACINIFVG
jgi:hypothetical protein